MNMPIEVVDQAIQSDQLALQGLDFIATGDQYLTFTLGEEHYGVDIVSVREIRGWTSPTRVPNAPEHVKGVTNLRGVIVPVVDLRIRFQVGEPTYTPTTVIIVLAIDSPAKKRTMGFVVDAVSDVLNADEETIKKAPEFSGTVDNEVVQGLVNVGNDVVTLLHVEELLSLGEEDDH